MDKCLLYGKTAVLSLSLKRMPLLLGAIVLNCIIKISKVKDEGIFKTKEKQFVIFKGTP